MKCTGLTLGLTAVFVANVAGQWLGGPAWNDPKAGSGFTIYGDYTRPNTDAGGGTAYSGRVMFGAGAFALTGGVASWKSDLVSEHITSFGGTAAVRVMGGSQKPVAVNLQVGGGSGMEITSNTTSVPVQTMAIGAVGVSLPLHTSIVRLEPYVSPGIRYHRYSNVAPGAPDHETNFGWVIGGNVDLGPLGIHLAYDSEKFADGTTHGVFGIGANIGLRPSGT